MTELTAQPVSDAEHLFADDVRTAFNALNAAIDIATDAGISVSFGISTSSGIAPKWTKVCELWMEKRGSWKDGTKGTKL